jgi:hypothetical protein
MPSDRKPGAIRKLYASSYKNGITIFLLRKCFLVSAVCNIKLLPSGQKISYLINRRGAEDTETRVREI